MDVFARMPWMNAWGSERFQVRPGSPREAPGRFAMGWLCAAPGLAEPPDKAAIESVLRSAPQKGGPEREVALAWANSLDPLARGLAQLLKDPEVLALLHAQPSYVRCESASTR